MQTRLPGRSARLLHLRPSWLRLYFLSKSSLDPLAAVLAYLGLTLMIFLGMIQAAKYWNIRYTAGFVISGLVLQFLVPNVHSIIADPLKGMLGNVLTLAVLVLLGGVLADKLDLDEVLSGW